ncbi:MAG: hypothetical protein ACRDP6_32490 [Actinoallomurus sp.]
MPSTAQVRDRATKRTRLAIIALIAGVVFLLAVIAVLLTSGGGSSKRPQARQPAPTPPVSSAPVSPDQWVQLPDPGGYVDKTFPVRFPHKPEGGVAALVASVQFGWSMDPASNSRVTGLYAAPQTAASAQKKAVDLASFWRQRIGVPATGPVPGDAAMRVVPIAVQWQPLDANRTWAAVEVQVQSTPNSATEPSEVITAVSAEMQWNPALRGGDWDYVPTAKVPPQTAQVDDPNFSHLGWRPLGAEH